MRSSTVPRPVMYFVSKLDEKSGAGRICSGLSSITSDTLSTTMPTMRPATFRMMTTVNWLYSASPRLNLMRMSTIGTMVPRRFDTPLMKAGALAMLGDRLVAADLLHFQDLDAVFLGAEGEGEVFVGGAHVLGRTVRFRALQVMVMIRTPASRHRVGGGGLDALWRGFGCGRRRDVLGPIRATAFTWRRPTSPRFRRSPSRVPPVDAATWCRGGQGNGGRRRAELEDRDGLGQMSAPAPASIPPPPPLLPPAPRSAASPGPSA